MVRRDSGSFSFGKKVGGMFLFLYSFGGGVSFWLIIVKIVINKQKVKINSLIKLLVETAFMVQRWINVQVYSGALIHHIKLSYFL